MTDAAIIQLFWERAETAVNAASEAYGGYCYRIAYNILCVNEDSEECVNDTFFKAWNAIPPQKPDILKAFLGKITRNLALDMLKRSKAGKRGGAYAEALSELDEIISSGENIEKQTEDKETVTALNSFIGCLDEESRTVFVLRYFRFDSISDIAEKTGTNINRVNYILKKTRSGLERFMKKEELL